MVGLRLLGLGALACLGCQTILPLADAGEPTDGGVQTDGSIPGDPMLLQPIPTPKPGCPADAVMVTASLPADGPRAYTRRAPVTIQFEAPGAARVEFRSALPGRVNQGDNTVEFSFSIASEPIWTDRYPFTVVAFDANGCAANARVDIPVDGDLLIGTRRGGIWYVGSDGRVLEQVPLNREGRPKVSALAIRRDAQRLLVGFDVDDTAPDAPITEPALIDLDMQTGDFVAFDIVDIQDEPIYPSGTEPDHLVWGPDGKIWGDGARDGALQVFHSDGRHDGTVVIPDQNTASVMGFFAGNRLFATSKWSKEVYTLSGGAAAPIVRIDDINEMRSIIPGWPTDQGEATFMVVTWNGNRPTLAQRFTQSGQYVDQRPLESFDTQIVLSGDDILARSTTGGIRVYDVAGNGENLLDTRVFLDAIGEDFVNLGAMIQLK